MKGIDILCASQASTAIRMMDEGSSSSSSTIHLGRAIDRYNPIIRDSTRIPKTPSSSKNQPPLTPKPRNQNTTTDSNYNTNTATSRKPASKGSSSSSSSKRNKNIDNDDIQKRKSITTTTSVVNSQKQSVSESKKGGWGCTKPGDFISPPGSTRYLLGDKSFLSDLDPTSNILAQHVKNEQSSVPLPPSSSRSPNQVVVLRVSLHCRGCERKMRKHISRMEGVTSFNIDFAAKKVTVIGDVTPLSVLASISKVKNAQLLPPAISSSAPAPATTPTPVVDSDRSDITKFNAVFV